MPLTLFDLVCITKVELFDKKTGEERALEVHACPQERGETTLFDSRFLLDSPSLFIELAPPQKDGGKWKFVLRAENLITIETTFELGDSMTWTQALSSDWQRYFYTHKTAGIQLLGQVTVLDKFNYECSSDECLMLVDSVRSHMSYPFNYVYANAQQAGLSLVFSDGIGINRTSNENFASIGAGVQAKITKLGHAVFASPDGFDTAIGKAYITTMPLNGNYCKLEFTSQFTKKQNIYAVLLALRQDAMYGYMKGRCTINNEKYDVDGWSFYEEVHWR
jgi:hypothetical protein